MRPPKSVGKMGANLPPGNRSFAFGKVDEAQFSIDIQNASLHKLNNLTSLVTIPVAASPKATKVFDAYWYFAAKRQEIFFRRFEGFPPPWTGDPILARHKFTNAYRASDRVSQYLIRKVIYGGDNDPAEVFFRILVFKLFNKIETWELLDSKLHGISYGDYSFKKYDQVLTAAMARGVRIYSAAYIMNPGRAIFGQPKKHRNHLKLIELLMKDEVALRICEKRSLASVFELLRSYPMLGDFLAFQYGIDINYSELINFSEMDFVIPGPGAKNGIRKCFADTGGLNDVDIIKYVADNQQAEFEKRGLRFRTLWGRPLQLIDCQNLFCEVDKYARVAHPEFNGKGGRSRIKQIFKPIGNPIQYWFPPKWGINHLIPPR